MLGNQHMNATAYTDTLIRIVNSVDGDTCSQAVVTDFDGVEVYPMEHRRCSPVSISKYFCYWGDPNYMHMDNEL